MVRRQTCRTRRTRTRRTAATLAAFALLAVAAAGCSGGGPGADAPADTGRDGGGAATGGAGGPAGAAGGQVEPPAWQVGQWWRWRVEAQAAPAPYEVVTTVLAADGSTYDIGAPDAQAAALAYPFHLVAFGPVPRATLAWQAHGTPVQFLRFPVVDGDSWTADFWSAPGATVTVRNATVPGPAGPEPGYRSEVTYAGGGAFMAASWSTARAQFVQVQTFFGGEAPFATATLADEGQGGMEGRPFRPIDIVRLSANPAAPATATPVQFQVPAEADLLLMACFLGGGAGSFEAVVAYGDPPPSRCSHQGSGSDLVYSATTRPAAGGTGELLAVPAGQGGVTVELFGLVTAAA